MEIVIAIVCVSAGLNLALWGALWNKLAGLPAAIQAEVRRERREGEARALTVLQEAAAARVGSITLALRSLEEQESARHRAELGAAETRARVAERRVSEVLPALGAASDLVRELRALLDWVRDAEAEEETVVISADRGASAVAAVAASPRPAVPPPAPVSDARTAGAS
jgi:hypothetical protein